MTERKKKKKKPKDPTVKTKLRTEKIKLIYTITEKYQHTNNSNIVYT